MPESVVPESVVPDAAEQHVRELLAAAGIPASDAEVTACVAGVPALRGLIVLLHAAHGTRYVDPVLRFRAEPGRA